MLLCATCISLILNVIGFITMVAGILVVSIDCMFLTGMDTFENPVMVMMTSESGGILAITVLGKGNHFEYASNRPSHIIEKAGCGEFVVNVDSESAITKNR